MSCGINIPLSSVVEEIINSYGDVLAQHIANGLDLSKFTPADGGIANNLTLKGGVTLDPTTVTALCGYLQECIEDNIELPPDNHVQEFAIDNANNLLAIRMKGGEVYSVSKEELEAWLSFNGGGAGGIKGGVLNDKTITITNNDDSTVDIDVSGLTDVKLSKGAINGNSLRLEQTDGSAVEVDLSAFKPTTTTDTHVARGEIVNGNTIRLHLSDGNTVDINAAGLVPNSPYITKGAFTERDGGHWLDFTRSDGSDVKVDMSDMVNKLSQQVYDRVMQTGYRINNQTDDYTTTGDDFNGRTIIRADKVGDQTITITKPTSETFIGKTLIVRKANGAVGTFTTLKSGEGVTIQPDDVTPLRRVGSSAILVYVGNGVYDVFGELP